MSSQKGNYKKSGQRYQNKTKFVVTFNETYQKMIDRASTDRLCPNCKGQIEWKMQYGKYKPPNSVSRCVKCQQKSVYKAYRKVCDMCSDEDMVCSKCLEVREESEDQGPLGHSDVHEMESFMAGLRVRSKRTVERKLKSELIMWSKDKKYFVEVDTGKHLLGLQFKKSYFDEEDEELWDDCEDDKEDEEDDDDEGDDGEDSEEEVKEKKPLPIKKETKQVPQPQQLHQSSRPVEHDDDDDSLEDEDEYFICRDEYSEGSCDLDYWQRTQKNFRYYFAGEDEQD